MNNNRTRSFWGWGYADELLPPKFVAQYKRMLQMALGLSELQEMEAPRLERLRLREPRFGLPAALQAYSTAERYDRASHTYGKAYRDIVRGLYGNFDNPPDYVAYPRSEDEIAQLMAFCGAQGIALIPYGGGSSVVGGVEAPRSTAYEGVISCDMRHFDQVLTVDPYARTARIQAGIYGPALEAGLKPHGLTLRHFPQSFEFSTLGGWIATRSGGHFATNYTHIDDFVQSIRMITPQGIWQTRALPGSGAGADPNRFLLGSEGILGIITEATLRLQTVPTFRAKATVRFSEEEAAIEAVRLLSQSALFPANCRLISPLESFSMGIGKGSDTVLLLGFESHDHPQQAKLARALAICGAQGGVWQENVAKQATDKQATKSNAAQRWKSGFLRAPYLRDLLVRCGLLMETFETAVTWDKFGTLHQQVLAKTQAAMQQHCGGGLIRWRFTHVYPDGPAPYYTVMAPAQRGSEIAQWDAIKEAASDAIIASGGTITHHHAVGKDHQRWYQQQHSPLFGRILANAKRTVDPQWILNPEVLLMPEA